MQTNLAYGGGGNNQFGDVMTMTNSEVGTLTQPLFMIPPVNSSVTEFPNTPSTSNDGGATNPQFGYLYNWCAAMGGQPGACLPLVAENPPNASITVCPAGWRLPTIWWNYGELYDLMNDVGGDVSGLLANFLAQFAGDWSGTFFGIGNVGNIWSSTVAGANPTEALGLWFNSGGGIGTLNNGRDVGKSVRCVAKEPLIMQEVTLDNCPTVRTLAVDARDNRTYWIRRIPNTRAGSGDLCWMETNLAYAGGGNNQFGDVMNIGTTPGTLTAGTFGPGAMLAGISTGGGQVCWGNNASMNTHGRGCFWEPVGSNPTTFPRIPSTSTTGVGQYGFLYNWCAAMRNQPEACQTAVNVPLDVNISICPAGWRLPLGGVNNNNNEFWNLNQAINGGATNTPSGLLTNSLFQYGGWFNGGGFSVIGTNGNYWSTAVAGADGARTFSLGASAVSSAAITNRGVGLSVRCVRD